MKKYVFYFSLLFVLTQCNNSTNQKSTATQGRRDSLQANSDSLSKTNPDKEKNNSPWVPMKYNMGYADGIFAIADYNNVLYAGGMNTETFGGIVMLDDNKWKELNGGLNKSGVEGAAEVNSLITYNNKLYVGGHFDSAGGKPAYNIATWDSKNWSSLSSGITSGRAYTQVNCFAIYRDTLYVGGEFDSAGGKRVNCIAKWDGKRWGSLSTGVISTDKHPLVYSFAIYKDTLYVGGTFDSAGGKPVNNVAKWDGKNWHSVGKDVKSGLDLVDALCVYKGELYVAGRFDSAGDIKASDIAKWDGEKWSALKGVFNTNKDVSISALKVFNNELYVGGVFDSIGGQQMLDIAKWDGRNWSSVNGGLKVGVNNFLVFSNDLYIGGGATNDDDDLKGGLILKMKNK